MSSSPISLTPILIDIYNLQNIGRVIVINLTGMLVLVAAEIPGVPPSSGWFFDFIIWHMSLLPHDHLGHHHHLHHHNYHLARVTFTTLTSWAWSSCVSSATYHHLAHVTFTTWSSWASSSWSWSSCVSSATYRLSIYRTPLSSCVSSATYHHLNDIKQGCLET